jgi:Patatin-like phospholipase
MEKNCNTHGLPAPEASKQSDPEIRVANGIGGSPRLGSETKLPAPTKHKLTFVLLTLGFMYLVVAKAMGTWRADGGGAFGFLWAFIWSYGAFLLIFTIVTMVVSFFWGLLYAAVKTWGAYAVALVLGPLALWYWVGAYNWLRDIVIATLVLMVVFLFRKRVISWLARLLEKTEVRFKGQRATGNWPRAVFESAALCRCYAVLAWLFFSWILASRANVWLGPDWLTLSKPLEANPGRFAALAKRTEHPTGRGPETDARAVPLRLGVALSGGGFRAALMHAGVLAALEDLGTPVAGLATVSGGSIIGGFYAMGGDPVAFKDAVAQGRFNLKRELFDPRNLLRLPCPAHVPVIDTDLLWFCSHSRIGAQADLLDRVLFNGKRVSDLQHDWEEREDWWTKPPLWLIGASDLLRGEAIGISAFGVVRRAQATPGRGLHREALRREPSSALFHDLSSWPGLDDRGVSELVAVSGAFPGAFGSTDFQFVDGKVFQFVDGGVTDNLGYSLLASVLEESTWHPKGLDADGKQRQDDTGIGTDGRKWRLDMIVISDGGMPLLDEKAMPTHMEPLRAMDVVYASAGIAVAVNSVRKLWLSPMSIREPELRDEDLRALPEAFRVRWKLKTLGDLQEDFRHVKRMFLRTSTLKDSFRPSLKQRVNGYFRDAPLAEATETVEALFRLGQYLVYFNSCELEACRFPTPLALNKSDSGSEAPPGGAK